jgi:hypothetical protein
MQKEELKNVLEGFGFKPDRFGHMQKKLADGVKLRVKFQAISVRYEFKPTGSSTWYLRSSAYLKNVKIMDDGRLKMGRYALGVKT